MIDKAQKAIILIWGSLLSYGLSLFLYCFVPDDFNQIIEFVSIVNLLVLIVNLGFAEEAVYRKNYIDLLNGIPGYIVFLLIPIIINNTFFPRIQELLVSAVAVDFAQNLALITYRKGKELLYSFILVFVAVIPVLFFYITSLWYRVLVLSLIFINIFIFKKFRSIKWPNIGTYFLRITTLGFDAYMMFLVSSQISKEYLLVYRLVGIASLSLTFYYMLRSQNALESKYDDIIQRLLTYVVFITVCIYVLLPSVELGYLFLRLALVGMVGKFRSFQYGVDKIDLSVFGFGFNIAVRTLLFLGIIMWPEMRSYLIPIMLLLPVKWRIS